MTLILAQPAETRLEIKLRQRSRQSQSFRWWMYHLELVSYRYGALVDSRRLPSHYWHHSQGLDSWSSTNRHPKQLQGPIYALLQASQHPMDHFQLYPQG